eukprot:s1828_g19.t1
MWVESLPQQFLNTALTTHQHTSCKRSQLRTIARGEQQDVTETIRFVFDKLGRSDEALLREVFTGENQCQQCGEIEARKETQIWCFSRSVSSAKRDEEMCGEVGRNYPQPHLCLCLNHFTFNVEICCKSQY